MARGRRSSQAAAVAGPVAVHERPVEEEAVLPEAEPLGGPSADDLMAEIKRRAQQAAAEAEEVPEPEPEPEPEPCLPVPVPQSIRTSLSLNSPPEVDRSTIVLHQSSLMSAICQQSL